MTFQVVAGRERIEAVLPTLRAATVPGETNDGVRLVVDYKAFNEPTQRAVWEARVARDEGLSLQQYSGTLDRVFRNAQGELCFCMLVLERTTSEGRHAYRSFNTVRGEVRQLIVLDASLAGSRRPTPLKPN